MKTHNRGPVPSPVGVDCWHQRLLAATAANGGASSTKLGRNTNWWANTIVALVEEVVFQGGWLGFFGTVLSEICLVVVEILDGFLRYLRVFLRCLMNFRIVLPGALRVVESSSLIFFVFLGFGASREVTEEHLRTNQHVCRAKFLRAQWLKRLSSAGAVHWGILWSLQVFLSRCLF